MSVKSMTSCGSSPNTLRTFSMRSEIVFIVLEYHSKWSPPLITSTNRRSWSTLGSGGKCCNDPSHNRYPKSSPASTQN